MAPTIFFQLVSISFMSLLQITERKIQKWKDLFRLSFGPSEEGHGEGGGRKIIEKGRQDVSFNGIPQVTYFL